MSRFFRRRKFCKFTADGIDEIDYKDLDTLKGGLEPYTIQYSGGKLDINKDGFLT